MKAKDMTLGELVCEYIHAYVEDRLLPFTGKVSTKEYTEKSKKINELRLELLMQFSRLEK